MTQPTRQEMLSAIEHKIARTWWGIWPWETGYYLPVMIGDILFYMEQNCFINKNWLREHDRFWEAYHTVNRYFWYWWWRYLPLSAQDDDCISYIFTLLSHD